MTFVVEVSDSNRAYDLGDKKAAYAGGGIPHYWVVDVIRRGVWDFAHPEGDAYLEGRFVAVGESLTVPVVGKVLEVDRIFPTAEPGADEASSGGVSI